MVCKVGRRPDDRTDGRYVASLGYVVVTFWLIRGRYGIVR
jgi:hypothetical protein